MGSQSAHEQTEVEVTPSQADAARLIIQIDEAAGKQTPGLIHEIAAARPSHRRVASGPPAEAPTSQAVLSIRLLPTQAPDRELRQETPPSRRLPSFGHRRRRSGPPEAR
jgi:hypothetical protein